MRKYDIKNKRNIGIILAISLLIIIMFSLVIKNYNNRDKNEYKVDINTLVFDKDKTIIKTTKDSIIKTKWNKKYYLIEDKQTLLGNTAITYNEESGILKLYGKYYEITSSDEINITSGETEIKSTALTKFYKLEDRKYLLVDKEISSADGLLKTTDFLLVELDKVGNATLTNHKVSLKTFSNTILVTTNYTFDIANEILTIGSDKIDLKKIIGSTNNYTKEDLIPEENEETTNTADGINTIEDNTAKEDNTANTQTNKQTIIEEAKKATKRTSIIALTSTINKIKVDYVIYDPKKEYSSVYMEVKKEDTSQVDTIYLSSNETSYEISSNILPSATYELTFKYSYIDENNTLHTETFDRQKITTKKPTISLKVTRTSKNKIDYLITTDNTYPLTSATLTIIKNNEVVKTEEITLNGNTIGSSNISLIEGDNIELKLTNIKSNNDIIEDLNSSYKFIY